mmetsp:Transcript_10001/g.15790  ORF Transcript_10001/g.15790 Transcript_10001/m.15790 type:complete len:115 (-) Transcript_10001:135-479(-)
MGALMTSPTPVFGAASFGGSETFGNANAFGTQGFVNEGDTTMGAGFGGGSSSQSFGDLGSGCTGFQWGENNAGASDSGGFSFDVTPNSQSTHPGSGGGSGFRSSRDVLDDDDYD